LQLNKRHDLFELKLLTDDRPFLFSKIAGALFAWGMNVVKADAFASQAGLVLDSFEFADLHRTLELNPSERERFADSIRDVLSGRASLDSMLSRRGAAPAALETKALWRNGPARGDGNDEAFV